MTFNENFPILKDYTYLNTAYSGLLSSEISEWRSRHDSDFVGNASIFRANNIAIFDNLRNNLAETFGCKIANTFLSSNFSGGFGKILDGIDSSHRFLLLNEDYPSVNYQVTSRGFAWTEVQLTANLEEDILSEIERFKPTIFAFSMTQYISGIKMQSKFIKALKTNYPNLVLIADGTQFLGTAPFDFNTSCLDALIGSGYKWLLGGYGNGYLFLSDRMRDLVHQKRKDSILPTAPFLLGRDYLSLALEAGHFDTLSFGTLNQSINYLKKIGFDMIDEKIQELAGKARVALYNKGLLSDWIMDRQEQSGIISMSLRKEVALNLESKKIICSPRGNGTRISFNFYNTEDDLFQLLDALD